MNYNAPPSFDDMYGSRYLSAADLKGREAHVTISAISAEPLTDRQTGETRPKLVVQFQGKTKGLVLNQTNAKALALGTRTENYREWVGARVVLFVQPTKMGDGVRLRMAVSSAPASNSWAAPTKPPAHHPAPQSDREPPPDIEYPQGADLNDEIPF